jgi:hypothetical protein
MVGKGWREAAAAATAAAGGGGGGGGVLGAVVWLASHMLVTKNT